MQRIVPPSSFPESDYTPYGYVDNPHHTALNRSGIVRSVPPIGFGFWCRALTFPYGEGARRPVDYLSFLHLSLNVPRRDGSDARLHTEDDFVLVPAFPGRMATPGATFGIEGLGFGGARIDVTYRFGADGELKASLKVEAPALGTVRVTGEDGSLLAEREAARAPKPPDPAIRIGGRRTTFSCTQT